MKKVAVAIIMLIFLTVSAIPCVAMGTGGTGDDVTDLVNTMNQYFIDYLPGVSESSRKAICDYTKEGLTSSKDRYFMPMMASLANLRKAGEAGKDEGITDVINDYNKMSKTAQDIAVARLTDALKGIFLNVSFSNGTMSVSSTKKITDIKFNVASAATPAPATPTPTKSPAPTANASTTPDTTPNGNTDSSATPANSGVTNTDATAPNQAMQDAADGDTPTPDVTTPYFTAYIPEFSQEGIDGVKALIKTYSDGGGGPAGSGALWRCIREIGVLMGRDVEMAADYSEFTVKVEGEKEFLKLSPEVQEQVIAKVTEGMSGIAVTATYENGVFIFTKLGEVQFTYVVKNAVQSEETPATTDNGENAIDDENSGSNVVFIIIGSVVLIGIVLLVVFRKKIIRGKI